MLSYGVKDLLDQKPMRKSLRLKPSHKDIKKDDWEKVCRLYTSIITHIHFVQLAMV